MVFIPRDRNDREDLIYDKEKRVSFTNKSFEFKPQHNWKMQFDFIVKELDRLKIDMKNIVEINITADTVCVKMMSFWYYKDKKLEKIL